MKYTFSYSNPASQYVDITLEVEGIDKSEVELQFPTWRPGRYQMGNFVANVQKFKVFDGDGKRLDCDKVSKDQWIVKAGGASKLRVEYNYYANELNGGSTYLDEDQLYVNPVNCCVYLPNRIHEKIEVELQVPDTYKVATSMESKRGTFHVADYDELADSPFIASAGLIHADFEESGVKFHLWFTEPAKPDIDRITKDFKAFTKAQIESFGDFPVDEYHYLIQVPPYKLYHGVEHQKSTVLALGPAYDLMGKLYTEFLGVSSHELYHTWNVKALRPVDMYPYDFSKENYSRLGYVAEGVTTYMGDLFLFRSHVFDFDQYAKELGVYLQRHFDNFGRFNHSVAESSFDTWIDGYQLGVPGKKVSIYVEGCLLAFITDALLLKKTGNKAGLQEVMKRLYQEFAKKGKGYSEGDYREAIEELADEDLSDLFDNYFYGTSPFETRLLEACDHLGLELIKEDSKKYAERRLGLKVLKDKIRAIAPGSPGEMAGLSIDDKIIAVNGFTVNDDLEEWLTFVHDEDETSLTIDRNGRTKEVQIPQVDVTFFKKYSVRRLEEPSRAQREAYNKWSWAKK